MTNHYAICLLITFLVPFATCSDNGGDTRAEKLISTFQVVRFPNDGCTGSNSRNGTCYTSQECSSKGGSSSGSCADGFGVCCTFVINTCGSSSSENLTAWTQPTTVNSGVCSLDVIPVSDDICSLRLDFTTFVITGPNTLSTASGRRRFGQPTEWHGSATAYVNEGINYATNCLTDGFYIQGASPSSNPPLICGTITGQHMYVEADVERGNRMVFHFADMATVIPAISRGIGTLATRTWDITISHIECTSLTLPPTGCTKYYWNAAGRANLQNYNFATGDAITAIHLAQQHERMCIRRERGKCTGCFSTAAGDFDISGGGANEEAIGHFTVAGGCCGWHTVIGIGEVGTLANAAQNGYSNAVGSQFGWDCIIIPGAFFTTTDDTGLAEVTQTTAELSQTLGNSPTATAMNTPSGPQICGSGAGIGPGVAILQQMSQTEAIAVIMAEGLNTATGLTVCTRHVPFTVEFMSDDLEGIGTVNPEFNSATGAFSQGFNMQHIQIDC